MPRAARDGSLGGVNVDPDQEAMPLRHSPGRRPKVLIAGGGAAGLETLIGLRQLAQERVEIELLTPDRHFVYRPLTVGEPFGLGAARRYELSRIAADHGASLTAGTLEAVDPGEHSVGTADGREIGYDALVVALGAPMGTVFPGAITLRGPGYTSHFGALLRQLEEGAVASVAFAAPGGVAWPLPLYEVALMTAARLAEAGTEGVKLSIVTPEAEPLELFGAEASAAIRELLEVRSIELRTGLYPSAFHDGELEVVPGGEPIAVERVVALPELTGPHIEGLPHDPDGFVPVDLHGRVSGEEDVYAAGDATGFPIKQGGLATQQADAVVEALAARVGVQLSPQPFRPVLRGLLLTGGSPRYLRAEISGGGGTEDVSEHALWWPPSKIAGRYLSPYLGTRHRELAVDADKEGVPVEIELESRVPPGMRRRGLITKAGGRTAILDVGDRHARGAPSSDS